MTRKFTKEEIDKIEREKERKRIESLSEKQKLAEDVLNNFSTLSKDNDFIEILNNIPEILKNQQVDPCVKILLNLLDLYAMRKTTDAMQKRLISETKKQNQQIIKSTLLKLKKLTLVDENKLLDDSINPLLLYEGEWDWWRSHPQGVVIQKGNQLLLNGKDLLYEGECDWWNSHPRGIIIQKGNQFLLNGKDLLYEGRWNDWRSHPQGVIIRIGNQFLLNGKDLIYQGEWKWWRSHPQGVIIQKGNQLLLNGKDLIYQSEWDWWGSHPQGIIIRKGNQFLLNGKDLIYEGECDWWQPHPQGIVIRKGGSQHSSFKLYFLKK